MEPWNHGTFVLCEHYTARWLAGDAKLQVA